MANNAPSPHENPLSPQDEQLLQRQHQLQNEAQRILEELNLIELLSQAGHVRQTGSTTLGLMVWRDIDLQVSNTNLSIAQAFELLHPLLTHPRVKQVRYLHQSHHFKLDGLADRYFFMVYYEPEGQAEWKLDISFWLGEGIHPEPVQEAIAQQLTPATRLTILQIKDAWYQLPAYRTAVSSVDIYDAVLQHNVRTLAEFDDYLAQRGKPTRTQSHSASS
jgi:hypothetical protein